MKNTKITRRLAFAIAAGAFASMTSGCAAVASLGRVVITLPWANIVNITSAVLHNAESVMRIVAQLPDAIKELTASISTDQRTQLADGGELILRSKSGQEFPVEFTVQ